MFIVFQMTKAEEYTMGHELGKGAYGVVYQVTHRPTGQKYALKRISIQITEDGVPQSVMREIAALVSLQQVRFSHTLYIAWLL